MICYRPKLTVWLGKLILSTKKHLKSWTTFWKGRLWRVLEAKPMTPGQLLGPPWKLWGITAQTSYWEGRSVGTRADPFLGYGQGNQWKTGLFCKLLRIRKFSMGKCFGASAHGILRHEKNFNNFYPVLVAWSRVSATKCGPLTKIWAVAKKYISHNFRNWALKLKSLLPIVYGKKWFAWASSIPKILGVVFFLTPQMRFFFK